MTALIEFFLSICGFCHPVWWGRIVDADALWTHYTDIDAILNVLTCELRLVENDVCAHSFQSS